MQHIHGRTDEQMEWHALPCSHTDSLTRARTPAKVERMKQAKTEASQIVEQYRAEKQSAFDSASTELTVTNASLCVWVHSRVRKRVMGECVVDGCIGGRVRRWTGNYISKINICK